MNLPSDLPARLRAAGLTVVEIDGWRQRGRPASTGGFAPVGVLHHHTGGPSNGGRPYAAGILTNGRSDLPGPLCHLSTDQAGTVYVVAAGRANHAGDAKAAGTVAAGDGNTLYVGVENQNLGTEGWTKLQYAAMVTLTAVLLKWLGSSVGTVHAHYETSVTGKWDPGDPYGVPYGGHRVLNMAGFRKDVEAVMVVQPKHSGVSKARRLLDKALRVARRNGKTARARRIRDALKILPPR